jgi:3D (Asp-Asp-Asp) domain-containing protein/peptidoglycan hydrolase CwlO-like protein
VQTRPGTSPARLAVILAGVLAAAAVPAAGGADPTATFGDRAADLRSANASLASRQSSALLDLYALDSRLAETRSELERLRQQAAVLEKRRADARLRLRIARRALAASQRQLGQRLRTLYVQGETDPVAVLLGSDSLDDAVARIDELERSAALNESVIAQTRAARTTLRALARRLAAQRARVRRLETAAAASEAALSRAAAERRSYIASLEARRRLNATQIESLETQAALARDRTERISTGTAPTIRPDPAELASGSTLTVVATGYSLPGTTATGLRVGWGVVAVDPSLIPLGTRMTIPGYGEGVAADVGHAVRGASIDLWFPTRAQALAWGRRTVTITLG